MAWEVHAWSATFFYDVGKSVVHNIFLMRRFISILGIEPDEEINRKLWEEGIRFAAIAA